MIGIAVPVFAHHSFPAEYDLNKPLFMDGKVTRVEWMNPHAEVFVDVTDKQGKTVNWDVQLTPPHSLQMEGMRRDTLKPGIDLCVEGFPEKNGKFIFGSLAIVLKSSGQIIRTPPGMWAPPGFHYTGKTSCSNRG
jgi:hypothetical protein